MPTLKTSLGTFYLPDQIVILKAQDAIWDDLFEVVLNVSVDIAAHRFILSKGKDTWSESIYYDEIDKIEWITPEKFSRLKAFI